MKWRIADGVAPGLAAQGIDGTGSVRPRNGPVVTAGGLLIVANDQDRMLRAYDKADGRLLWSHELPANPEGIPAVYEVRGRQYIAFSTSSGRAPHESLTIGMIRYLCPASARAR